MAECDKGSDSSLLKETVGSDDVQKCSSSESDDCKFENLHKRPRKRAKYCPGVKRRYRKWASLHL